MDIGDNCPDPDNADQANGDGDPYGDACDNCPAVATVWVVPVGDGDCDGFTDADEGIIGTDPGDRCADTLDADDEADDKWPSDFDDNQRISVADVFNILPPRFGSATGDPYYSQRRDLIPDGVINIVDIFRVLPPAFGSSCTP